MTWTAPGRAHVSFLTPETGEYLVEVDGARARLLIATPPERAVLPHDPGWAQRLAAAGGGSVLSPAEKRFPGVRPRERVAGLAPGVIALAAILFCIDASLRVLRWTT